LDLAIALALSHLQLVACCSGMLSDQHGGCMYPSLDTTAEFMPEDALELLVQQQQLPQQQLSFSGQAPASFELAGPLSPQLRDVCRKSEQDIDQEIGQLLAMKQQLRQRQQQAQRQVQQLGGASVARSVQLAVNAAMLLQLSQRMGSFLTNYAVLCSKTSTC
jgi:hypothetical protein